MGAASRAKGRRAQTEGSALLEAAGWRCVDTSAGMATEDVFALDPDTDAWSVEVTADGTISLTAKWRQASRQADERGGVKPLLLWKVPAPGGWWLIGHEGDFGRRRWRGGAELAFEPPAAVAHRTYLRQLMRLRPVLSPTAPLLVVLEGPLVMAPAELALQRWWSAPA